MLESSLQIDPDYCVIVTFLLFAQFVHHVHHSTSDIFFRSLIKIVYNTKTRTGFSRTWLDYRNTDSSLLGLYHVFLVLKFCKVGFGIVIA